MATYKISSEKAAVTGVQATLLRVGFADPAQNDQIVRDAVARLAELVKAGTCGDACEPADEAFVPMSGTLVLINGAASLPVACAICHGVSHRFETVAVFDPKLGKYVVAVSHGATYKPGDLIS